MRGGIPRLKDTVSGRGDKLRHLGRVKPWGIHRGATGGGVSWSVPWALPWRKRVGIEPTIPGTNPESTDLKSAEAARPHALPTERARLSRPVERDPGGADGDRTRDLVNAIHARSQLRHSPNSGPERKGCRSALPRSADFSSQPRFSPRHRPSGRPAVRGSGYLGTSVTV